MMNTLPNGNSTLLHRACPGCRRRFQNTDSCVVVNVSQQGRRQRRWIHPRCLEQTAAHMQVELNQRDLKILTALGRQPRPRLAEIAREVGCSHYTVDATRARYFCEELPFDFG